MEFKIYISKKVVKDSNVTNEGLAVYVALRKMMNSLESDFYVSTKQIVFTLLGHCQGNIRYTENNVKAGIQNLVDAGYIDIKENIGKTEYVIDLSKLEFETYSEDGEGEFFTIIYLSEVQQIMNTNKDKFKLLRYFITVVGTLSNKVYTYVDVCESISSFVGYMTIQWLADNSGIDSKQAVVYNQCLEENGLLYIHRSNDFYCKDGQVKTIHNCYGRVCDTAFIVKYATEYQNQNKSFKSEAKRKADKANKVKSMLMKYNALASGKKYSDKEEKEIYDFIVQYNKDNEKHQEKQKSVEVFTIVNENHSENYLGDFLFEESLYITEDNDFADYLFG